MAWVLVLCAQFALAPHARTASAQETGQESLKAVPTVLPPTIFDEDEVWASVGPRGIAISNGDVISGQVNAIAVHPTDANTLYIGASEGGVWKTTNGGASWTALTDFQLTRALPGGIRRGTLLIGSLAIDSARPNVIYAGTGNPNFATGFMGSALGVFRSANAGQTWEPTGVSFTRPGCQNAAMSQSTVNRMLVRQGLPTQVLAATNTGLYTYREDGSDCWIRVTQGLPFSGNAIDLAVDHFAGVFYTAYSGIGIFRSQGTNVSSWSQLTQGLPAAGTKFGRIALTFAGRNGLGFSAPSKRLYAGFDVGGKYHLFHTANGGDLWAELPVPPSDGQLGFNNAIAAGSYNSDEVYVAQIALRRAMDGGRAGGLNNPNVNPPVTGNSWDNLSCCISKGNTGIENLDLHADIHDVVFAPYGSFLPTPLETQIVFIANDGGVTRGSVDFEGVVRWTPLTMGLAIGQCGALGLHPNNRDESACGLWHNGNALLNSVTGVAVPVGGGDGFNATIDAATPTTIYIDCNAGFGGDICRHKRTNAGFPGQTIWDIDGTTKHFSDPYRPGHLLMIQGGLLFRTTAGNTASNADLLNGPNAWVLIEPPGKSGNTTTMAFRSWVLEETPVYYFGTDTGQIWRGSPEAGFTKICECGARVNGISPDLFRNERIVAVFNGATSPGRVKLLSRQGATWANENIDTAFTVPLQVRTLTSVAFKPVVPFIRETTVYVGSDQGLYRGRLGAGGWTWTQAAGFPNVLVTDLKAHQSATFFDLTFVVRASTFGRGIYELRRSQGPVLEQARGAVQVRALRVGEDGAPPELTIDVQASSARERGRKQTPFELAPVADMEVTLEAPLEVTVYDATLEFGGWTIDGKRRERQNRITLKLDQLSSVVANYSVKQKAARRSADRMSVSLNVAVRDVCVAGLSHELTLTSEVTGGQRPIAARVDITYPDKTAETTEIKQPGARQIPVNFPRGGSVTIRVTATDAAKGTAYAERATPLRACP
jgi:photosystem II stability/assembly factor-like uncharacterized protein